MNDKKKRQSMILYVIIAIAAIVALQSVVYPSLERAQVREVSYSEFIDMVDDNKVDEVSLDTNSGKITFTSKDEENVTYRATMWPNDDTLSERLNKHNVTYSAQIADQNSGLLSLLWFCPSVALESEKTPTPDRALTPTMPRMRRRRSACGRRTRSCFTPAPPRGSECPTDDGASS